MAKKRSDFEYRRMGMEFKDGKLYNFTDRHVVVMSAWPNPRAWIKRRSHGWQCTRIWGDRVLSSYIRTHKKEDWLPDDSLGAPPELEPEYMLEETEEDEARNRWFENRHKQDRINVDKYMSVIPDSIRTMIGEYADRNWQVMNLFARCPGTEDLHHSNPALLMALANSWSFQKNPVKRPMRSARNLIYRKQKHILNWLGFPPTGNVRNILSKIPADCLKLEYLLYLRHWMGDERVLKYLSHLDRINEIVINMVTSEERLRAMTPTFLAELSRITNKRKICNIQSLLHDTIHMARRVHWRDCPRSFSSLARLKSVHDQLVEYTNRNRSEDYKNMPEEFPAPPFQGTPSIWPITTPRELFEEGRDQRNCVASHAESVLKGHEYVYRVYYPVRATLSVIRCSTGEWIKGQIAEACNQTVDATIGKTLFDVLNSSGPPPACFISEQEDDTFDLQLPLGLNKDSWAMVQRVEYLFGKSVSIDIDLPNERRIA